MSHNDYRPLLHAISAQRVIAGESASIRATPPLRQAPSDDIDAIGRLRAPLLLYDADAITHTRHRFQFTLVIRYFIRIEMPPRPMIR